VAARARAAIGEQSRSDEGGVYAACLSWGLGLRVCSTKGGPVAQLTFIR
jgi:hypothetical protein